jgi:hypothetical protein
MEDERAADPCSLRGRMDEDHRDMQKGRIELALTVIEDGDATDDENDAS